MNTFAIGRFFSQSLHAFDMVSFQLQRLAGHGLQAKPAHNAGGGAKPFSVTLAPMTFWECEAAPGQTIECRDGLVWITQTGDFGDHIVESGGRWTAGGHGRVVVQAMTQATIHIQKS